MPPHSMASPCGFRFYWADSQEAAYVKFLTLKNPLWLMSSFPSKTSTQGQFPSSSSFQDGSSKWPSQESREISRANICISWQKTGAPWIPALPTPTPCLPGWGPPSWEEKAVWPLRALPKPFDLAVPFVALEPETLLWIEEVGFQISSSFLFSFKLDS